MNAGVKVEITAVNNVQGTATEIYQFDCNVNTGCSSTCNFSSNVEQSEKNIDHVNPKVTEKGVGVKSSSAVRRRLSKAKTRKRIRDRTARLLQEQPLHHGQLSERDGKRLSWPQCQRPVADVLAETLKSETVKTEVYHRCGSDDVFGFTVDSSQLGGLECTCTSKLDSSRQNQSLADDRTVTNSATDGRSSSAPQGRWQLRCSICSRCCATAAALKRHEEQVHHAKGKSRSNSCRTCGKRFRHASYARFHERHVHASGGVDDRLFVCDVCGKGFFTSSSLTTHRRTHSGDRPYACSICQKRFYQLGAVREHEKIHVGVKMFVCDVCGKQFMTAAQLFNHSRTHGSEKAFECQVKGS